MQMLKSACGFKDYFVSHVHDDSNARAVFEGVEKFTFQSKHDITVDTKTIPTPNILKGIGEKAVYRLFKCNNRNGKLFEFGLANAQTEDPEYMYMTYAAFFDQNDGTSYGKKLPYARKLPYNDTKMLSWVLGKLYVEDIVKDMFSSKNSGMDAKFSETLEQVINTLIILSR